MTDNRNPECLCIARATVKLYVSCFGTAIVRGYWANLVRRERERRIADRNILAARTHHVYLTIDGQTGSWTEFIGRYQPTKNLRFLPVIRHCGDVLGGLTLLQSASSLSGTDSLLFLVVGAEAAVSSRRGLSRAALSQFSSAPVTYCLGRAFPLTYFNVKRSYIIRRKSRWETSSMRFLEPQELLERHWRQSWPNEAKRFVWSGAPKNACGGILGPMSRQSNTAQRT